ncbi:hypothetical protein SNE40_019293 [Patella caerulea]|uniref:SOCS box domain-containing protein n=2 Tax=Patella caerulea TaxID=87958 RepID=A0AAN8J6B4_PATCE
MDLESWRRLQKSPKWRLEFTIYQGDMESFEYLLDTEKMDTATILECCATAIYENHMKCLRYLIEKAKCLSIDIFTTFPGIIAFLLHCAIEVGSIEGLKYLISEGADVNKRYYESTLLHKSVLDGRTDVTEFLVSLPQINKNQVSSKGRTPLMDAAFYGSVDCLHILIEKGCNVNFTNDNGVGAIHCCFSELVDSKSRLMLLIALVKAGANINQADSLGWTPLHYAAWKRCLDAVTFLIYHNCELDMLCAPVYGTMLKTNLSPPFLLALERKCLEVADVLVKSGCTYTKFYWAKQKCSKDENVYKWLNNLYGKVPSLKSYSRKMIRGTLGKNIHSKIDQLTIPDSLKHYILLKDVLPTVETVYLHYIGLT